MLVHVEVAGAPKAQVEATVASDLLRHVVEEAETCGHLNHAARVQSDLALELRFAADPLHVSHSLNHSISPRSHARGRSAPPCAQGSARPPGASSGRQHRLWPRWCA